LPIEAATQFMRRRWPLASFAARLFSARPSFRVGAVATSAGTSPLKASLCPRADSRHPNRVHPWTPFWLGSSTASCAPQRPTRSVY